MPVCVLGQWQRGPGEHPAFGGRGTGTLQGHAERERVHSNGRGSIAMDGWRAGWLGGREEGLQW